MKIIDILIIFVVIAAISGCIGQKPKETPAKTPVTPVETPIFSTDTGRGGSTEFTVAYLSDGRPSQEKSNSKRNLTIDFNQIITQSPTKLTFRKLENYLHPTPLILRLDLMVQEKQPIRLI